MASDAAEDRIGRDSKGEVFISYSRKDIAFADKLDAALRARGFEPLIDRSDIYAFEEWWKRVEELIARADTVIFVLSPNAVTPGSVALKEVAFAASLNKRFAPIVFRAVSDKDLPEALAKINFIFFDDEARFEQSADKLARALGTDIGWIRKHTEFGETARRWLATGRPAGLLLRPPLLEEAEAWIRYRPQGAPLPTADTETFVAQSRKADIAAKRRDRFVQTAIYVLLFGIILGLIGWINQDYLKDQMNWYMTMRPYRVANIDSFVLSAEAERALKPGQTFKECAKDCPEMVVVQAGEFMMGSPPSEIGRYTNEDLLHKVTITTPFAVSKFDVTFDDWDTCVVVGGCPQVGRAEDAGWGRLTRPVIDVSWDDAQAYVTWLSRMTGKTYRLLTEAEWEYAARAGTRTAYYWGDEIGKSNANCQGCGSQWDERRQTAPVGSFKSNVFGLYDMAGNVWQWVQDCYLQNYIPAPTDGSAWAAVDCKNRVIRGGSWLNEPRLVRCARRSRLSPNYRANNIGFRVARTLVAATR